MENNKSSLEGIVSKLKNQGIKAGEEEKLLILEEAKKQAAKLISDAQETSKQMIEKARNKSAQLEENTKTALKQASRDMVEATKISILQHLKSIFREQCDVLFTQEQYLEELLKAVLENVSGKKTVTISPEMLKHMESFLITKAMTEKVVLKPLGDNSTKIVVDSTSHEGVRFVLSSQDVEEGLFSLLNKDLVMRIAESKEVQ